jgi:Asp-tRNA(Asn)/Glu-tRNA(Gln) amidotransferase A subunit family amidase
VQVIGRPLDDARCLAAAGFVEQAILTSVTNAGTTVSHRAAV